MAETEKEPQISLQTQFWLILCSEDTISKPSVSHTCYPSPAGYEIVTNFELNEAPGGKPTISFKNEKANLLK